MADEVDVVDIEGDECDERVGDLNSAEILQDQYLQSAWKTNSSILPWTLDSSISDENRQAIESMLLEEQRTCQSPSSNETSDTALLPSSQPHVSALTNAVRIEQLSDDEDVDITDGVSGSGLQSENQLESPECNHKEELSPPPPPSGVRLNQVKVLRDEEEEYQEEEEEEEEEEELRAPDQEVLLDLNTITEEEKQAIPEFFEGRPESKPKYLNKTSVRPGLKNCGDVNCIGRIHTYLELIGAINFNCDQAIYNRPRLVDRSRLKENKDSLEAYHLAQRLQSMRTRKRRIRDMWGNWCDAKDLEGQTYEEPYKVIVCAEALVVMDIHAHVSMGEVIGLLGGTYEEEEKVLKICAAEPCNSLSTGLQCEMDPVSQTQASELLGVKGHSVVGWYHSHPAFDPNPSLRDIDTQAKYQSYFSRGGAPFIGMIVSPYNSSNPSPLSQTTCLLVQEETGPSGPQRFPYRFNIQHSSELPDWSEVMRRAEWVVFKYRLSHGSVPMDRLFRRDSSLTCLEKVIISSLHITPTHGPVYIARENRKRFQASWMLASIRRTLEQVSEIDIETFLVQIESLFKTHFLPETGSSSCHLLETVRQPELLSFVSSEPISSSHATDDTCVTESDSPDEEEDAAVTQSVGAETV
ncbi:histone H2A deubiquitinase MYSM1-like [Puntigrus tetrazona]|uniref:histone H2A deubiquitinase MYSM1-like n=1 Tax=Puntigrus tetrazona TaxID=1606681 RepID=UPI001C8A2BC2|nr:histone H2A deubiquitinase MYSM1-like [Puntigrus tetrazona]